MDEKEIKQKITEYIEVVRFLEQKMWELVSELDKIIGEEKTEEFIRQFGMGRAKARAEPVLPKVEDFTWAVCKDCIHRVKRYIMGIGSGIAVVVGEDSKEHLHEVIEGYVCEKGLNRDRNPDFCPEKVERGKGKEVR